VGEARRTGAHCVLASNEATTFRSTAWSSMPPQRIACVVDETSVKARRRLFLPSPAVGDRKDMREWLLALAGANVVRQLMVGLGAGIVPGDRVHQRRQPAPRSRRLNRSAWRGERLSRSTVALDLAGP